MKGTRVTEAEEGGFTITPAVTVPQLMSKYQVPGFDFVKMDIEGEMLMEMVTCPSPLSQNTHSRRSLEYEKKTESHCETCVIP